MLNFELIFEVIQKTFYNYLYYPFTPKGLHVRNRMQACAAYGQMILPDNLLPRKGLHVELIINNNTLHPAGVLNFIGLIN